MSCERCLGQAFITQIYSGKVEYSSQTTIQRIGDCGSAESLGISSFQRIGHEALNEAQIELMTANNAGEIVTIPFSAIRSYCAVNVTSEGKKTRFAALDETGRGLVVEGTLDRLFPEICSEVAEASSAGLASALALADTRPLIAELAQSLDFRGVNETVSKAVLSRVKAASTENSRLLAAPSLSDSFRAELIAPVADLLKQYNARVSGEIAERNAVIAELSAERHSVDTEVAKTSASVRWRGVGVSAITGLATGGGAHWGLEYLDQMNPGMLNDFDFAQWLLPLVILLAVAFAAYAPFRKRVRLLNDDAEAEFVQIDGRIADAKSEVAALENGVLADLAPGNEGDHIPVERD